MSGWRQSEGRSASARGYGADWQRQRAIVLSEEPWCRECGAATTDVDHIIAKVNGGTDARSNLRGLCGPCHHRKTGREHGKRSSQRPHERHPGEIA
jgi:5-methylcytosine-specific restriction protein A